MTLADIVTQLKESNMNIKDIKFRTIDSAIIPETEILGERVSNPFLMKINN